MANLVEFSILRANPDARRREDVNIGIAVAGPDGLIVRMPELRKIHCLTGHSWADIGALYEDRLRAAFGDADSLAALQGALISDVFYLSEPGQIRATGNLEQQIDSILDAFVAKPKLTKSAKLQKINAEMKKFFKSRDVFCKPGQTVADHRVQASFTVSLDKGIVADFAFRNGAMRIASTLDLRGTAHARARVFEKGSTLYFAKKELGSSTGLFGVYAAYPDEVETHQSELAIFNDYADGNTFNWMLAKDQIRFAQTFY